MVAGSGRRGACADLGLRAMYLAESVAGRQLCPAAASMPDVAGRRWTGAGAEAGAGARGARRSKKRQNLVGHTDTAVGNAGKHGPLKASIHTQARHQAVAPFPD